MKSLRNLLIASLFLFMYFHASAGGGDVIKESFSVKGTCMMCKATIENSVKSLDGVVSAKWNLIKQKVVVKFDLELISLEEIQKTIAAAGYDTDEFKASDEDYNNLHHCCKYDRK